MLVAWTGCAQMFSPAVNDLVLENPASRDFAAPSKTALNNLKIDPLMLENLGDQPAKSADPAAKSASYDRFGTRKSSADLNSTQPLDRNENNRLDPIAKNAERRTEPDGNGRQPILLRARQIETQNLPPVDEPKPISAPQIDEHIRAGSQANLLTPQLPRAHSGGDFIASAQADSKSNKNRSELNSSNNFLAVDAKTPPQPEPESKSKPMFSETGPPTTNQFKSASASKPKSEQQAKAAAVSQPESSKMDGSDFVANNLAFSTGPPFASQSEASFDRDRECMCLAEADSLPCERASVGENRQDSAGIDGGNEIEAPESDTGSFFEKMIAASLEMGEVDLASSETDVAAPIAATEMMVSHCETGKSNLNWRSQLNVTIQVFEDEIERAADDDRVQKLRTGLSILQALEKNYSVLWDDGDRSTNEMRQYWEHQIQAIDEVLKYPGAGSEGVHSASLALQHLQDAVHELSALAELKLPFAIFCTKVSGYGQYKPFASFEFASNQDVLVYCEIDNFAPLLETRDGITNYKTKLSSSFWITGDKDTIVQQQDFPVVTDDARNLRRDFFMHLPVTFADLPTGNYQLHVQVRDHGSGKVATLEQPLGFSVR